MKSFDTYHPAGRGPDVQRWLSAHDARSWLVDRKGGAPLAILHAAVSIVGGIQLPTLRRVLGEQHLENGLAARLLVVMPPRVISGWREADIATELRDAYRSFLSVRCISPCHRSPARIA